MKLLVAKRNGMTDAHLSALEALGFELILDAVDYRPYGGNKSDIEAVICYEFFKHNPIEDFPSLRVIHLTSAGFDHMPLDYLRERGITLYNARGVYSAAIAEFVLWGVLDLYKQGGELRRRAAARDWRQLRDLREIAGKRLCILGAGSIAAEIARRFSAMGAHTTALCRHPEGVEGFDEVRHVGELDAVLAHSDITVLAAPLTSESRHMFNAERFGKMKRGSVFVNIARGGIVDTEAFIGAMGSGQLSGAVMDVFETEPLPASSPIWDMANVIVTPHNAFAGEFNGQRTFELMHRDLKAYLEKNNF